MSRCVLRRHAAQGSLVPPAAPSAGPVPRGENAPVTSDSILVVDVGTSGLRAAIVRPDASVEHVHYRRLPPATPFPGLVEFDAAEMATVVLELAQAALADGGPV